MEALDTIRRQHELSRERLQLLVCKDCSEGLFPTRRHLQNFLENHFKDFCRGVAIPDSLHRRLPRLYEYHHDAHLVVPLEIEVTTGLIRDPQIITLLESINPALLSKAIHFDDRAPMREDVHKALNSIGRTDLRDQRRVPTYKRIQGRRGLRLKQPAQESQGELLLRVAMRDFSPDMRGKRQDFVRIESGLQPFHALGIKALPVMDRYHFENRGIQVEAHGIALQQHLWYVLLLYLAITGEHELLQQFNANWQESRLTVEETFWQVDLHPREIRRIKGDLAVLQFGCIREVASMPKVKTLEDLFVYLHSLGYPRLEVTVDRDRRQAFDRILADIAYPASAVRIWRIDWEPLLSQVHFKQRGKK
ncbi:hypothetical protein D3C72_819460 [compost metagenome]